MGVPLSYLRECAALPESLVAIDGQSHIGLVGGGDDGTETRLIENRFQNLDKLYLRLVVEVAPLLHAVGIPEVRHRLVERLQRLELDAVFVLVVLAHIDEIVGELLVVLRLQVVLAAIDVSAHATAVGHVVGTRVAERLEDGIRPFLAYLQHDLALCLVAVPVVLVAREVLESLHLSTQPLAAGHVVLVAVLVLGVVTTAYVVTEMAVVQTRRTCQPRHDLVNLLVTPPAAHASPPAERNTPAVELLTYNGGEHRVRQGVSGHGAIHLVAEEPVVLHVRPVLVGIDLGVGIVAVGAQTLPIALTTNAKVGTLGLLKQETCVVAGVGGDERRVP